MPNLKRRRATRRSHPSKTPEKKGAAGARGTMPRAAWGADLLLPNLKSEVGVLRDSETRSQDSQGALIGVELPVVTE